MNLTAWPGRGFLPDVGEAVATYWERVGLKVKRRPMDRAVFQADFRARTYAGVALAYAGPTIAPEPLGVAAGWVPYEGDGATAARAPHAGCRDRSAPGGAQLRGAGADHARGARPLALRVHAWQSALDPRTPSSG